MMGYGHYCAVSGCDCLLASDKSQETSGLMSFVQTVIVFVSGLHP